MGELVWTCADGREFASQASGLRIVVGRRPQAVGFTYRIFPATGATPLASGHADEFRDAIDAAEQTVRRMAATSFNPSAEVPSPP